METTSGPVPATARSAARRAAARCPASSDCRNGATWAMPSRHDASCAGADRPVGTVIVRTRTSVNPAADAWAASRAVSCAAGPASRCSDGYHAGGWKPNGRSASSTASLAGWVQPGANVLAAKPRPTRRTSRSAARAAAGG